MLRESFFKQNTPSAQHLNEARLSSGCLILMLVLSVYLPFWMLSNIIKLPTLVLVTKLVEAEGSNCEPTA